MKTSRKQRLTQTTGAVKDIAPEGFEPATTTLSIIMHFTDHSALCRENCKIQSCKRPLSHSTSTTHDNLSYLASATIKPLLCLKESVTQRSERTITTQVVRSCGVASFVDMNLAAVTNSNQLFSTRHFQWKRQPVKQQHQK